MTLRLLATTMLLAATCERQLPAPQPAPDPTTVIDEVEDAGAPDPDAPLTNCEVAWAHLADLECQPAEGHAAWLVRCSNLPAPALACVLATDVCGIAYDCLE